MIICAGSGKSTIGKKLAAEHHFGYLDKDVVCNTFTGKLLEAHGYSPHDRDVNAYYRDTVMDLEYETLLDVANDNLQLGRSIILDAPFGGYFHKSDYIDHLTAKYDWEAVTPVVLRVEVKSRYGLWETKLKHRKVLLDPIRSKNARKASGPSCTSLCFSAQQTVLVCTPGPAIIRCWFR
ncbi:AAA family ATPase [Paenibacillus sp. PCH8]|uniref:AAA family ATPase n=1 Tax=Paenibacillus sp. PCH8 TaxID=2066524 RepID=UPI002157BDDF|nr:AAA family ATPase [Paenibacillus sp. PCH8]